MHQPEYVEDYGQANLQVCRNYDVLRASYRLYPHTSINLMRCHVRLTCVSYLYGTVHTIIDIQRTKANQMLSAYIANDVRYVTNLLCNYPHNNETNTLTRLPRKEIEFSIPDLAAYLLITRQRLPSNIREKELVKTAYVYLRHVGLPVTFTLASSRRNDILVTRVKELEVKHGRKNLLLERLNYTTEKHISDITQTRKRLKLWTLPLELNSPSTRATKKK